MIYRTILLVSLLPCLNADNFFSVSAEDFLKKNELKQDFTVKQTDYLLIDAAIFHLINQKRELLGLKPLQHNVNLYQTSRKMQSVFEFRPFIQREKINARIRKELQKNSKSLGFNGQLFTAFALQTDGLKWEEKALFHYDENAASTTGFHLYQGKSNAKEKVEILPVSYLTSAQMILAAFSPEEQKVIFSDIYDACGIHLMWYYKTLNRRKIPQVKTLIILGGYATKGVKSN